MADFRTGKQLIKDTAENKGGGRKFTPNIYWNDGDIRTIAFLTAAEDIPKVRLHKMVRIPDDSRQKGVRYETFLCHKDPSMLDASGGACDLCDRVGHAATESFVALAVELEPIKDGKYTTGFKVQKAEVKREDGTTAEYVRWGLIIQGAKNFYSWLVAYDENKAAITDKVFEIQRDGGSTDTKYHFFPEDAARPDLDAELADANIPTLYELLTEMGSAEKYEQVAAVQPGSQPSFGAKKDVPASSSNGASRESKFSEIRSQLETYN